MKVIGLNLVKSEVLDLMHMSRDYFTVCTYSYEITTVEMFEFVQMIEREIVIDIIVGKTLPVKLSSKLDRLYNIAVYHNEIVHSKIYLNESEAIITSCNFGNLAVPRLLECGVRFTAKEFRKQHSSLVEQLDYIKSNAQLLIPRTAKEEKGPIDLKDFF